MREKTLNLGLVMAIALVIASKRLQKHTGIAAEDWRKELLEQAMVYFNIWTVEKIQRYIGEYYS